MPLNSPRPQEGSISRVSQPAVTPDRVGSRSSGVSGAVPVLRNQRSVRFEIGEGGGEAKELFSPRSPEQLRSNRASGYTDASSEWWAIDDAEGRDALLEPGPTDETGLGLPLEQPSPQARSLDDLPELNAAAVGEARGTASQKVSLKVGEIVQVDCSAVPREVFEISDELRSKAIKDVRGPRAFERSARRSIILSMGVMPASFADTTFAHDHDHTLDPYAKASERDAVEGYMAVVLGFGFLSLPRAMALCGLAPGILAILGMSAVNLFWIRRMVEVPELLEANLERFADIARVGCGRLVMAVLVAVVVWTWFAAAFTCLVWPLATLGNDETPDGNAKFILDFLITFLAVPFSWWTKVLQLRKSARAQVRLAVVVLALVACDSVWHGTAPLRLGVAWPAYKVLPSNPGNFAEGLLIIGSAFYGVAIVPYIVSDMHIPKTAKRALAKANKRITLIFLAMSCLGYFGYGDALLHPPPGSVKDYVGATEIWNHWTWMTEGSNLPRKYNWFGFAVIALLALKFVNLYPLFFWPLVREIDAVMALEESPPVKLRVPWAISRYKRTKTYLRILIASLMIILTRLVRFTDNLYSRQVFVALPFNLTNSLIPAMFSIMACIACRSRLSLEQLRASRGLSGKSAPRISRKAPDSPRTSASERYSESPLRASQSVPLTGRDAPFVGKAVTLGVPRPGEGSRLRTAGSWGGGSKAPPRRGRTVSDTRSARHENSEALRRFKAEGVKTWRVHEPEDVDVAGGGDPVESDTVEWSWMWDDAVLGRGELSPLKRELARMNPWSWSRPKSLQGVILQLEGVDSGEWDRPVRVHCGKRFLHDYLNVQDAIADLQRVQEQQREDLRKQQEVEDADEEPPSPPFGHTNIQLCATIAVGVLSCSMSLLRVYMDVGPLFSDCSRNISGAINSGCL